MYRVLLMGLGLCLHACSAIGATTQDNDDKEWDVNDPYDNISMEEIEYTIDEGTWMNLDVSPDGEEIVFDLLGNIYIMPVEGGEATPLREYHAYEVQPRFSPDGEKISFTSDKGGGDNIWVMDRDGSNARQVTEESFRLLNNAVWTEDGEYLIARKHFTSTRSLGAGELWKYHNTGGSGIQLVERMNDQQDLGQPFLSPEGEYIFYSQDVYPGGMFQYDKDPNSQIYVINRYDRETGETERVTGGSGGAISPTISPDGDKMAFIKRVREKSVLYIRDLTTGEEWPVYDELSRDQQNAWAIFGPYTNFNWTPDGDHLIFYARGKIRKLDVDSYEVETIPFEADVRQRIAEAVRFEHDPAPDTFESKAIRHAKTSPEGNTLIFNAAGFLWEKDLPNGTPQRLTDSEELLEFEPHFSQDGRYLLFVTWHDEDKGAIHRRDLNTGETVQLTEEKGIYRKPRFNPEGDMIVYRKESGNNHQGHTYGLNPGIYTMTVDGEDAKKVLDHGSDARFNEDGSRIYFLSGSYLAREYKSVDLNGHDERVHFNSKYANNFVPSPDGNWVAFNELFKVYIAPMPRVGTDITLSADTRAIPVTHVAEDAGISLHWSGDSDELHWTLGKEYFSVSLDEAFDFLNAGGEGNLPLGDSDGIDIGLELETDKPDGIIAITNARIITVNENDEVIENGTVVVRENRIEAVGEAGEVDIPDEAYVKDADGKTIMPGLVDAHAHIGNFRHGLSPNQQWEYFANLAYGVTTAHDPSSNTEMIFSQSEMVRAGNMIGPRIFSTGRILYGAEGDFRAIINSLEDAKSHLRRTKAFGAFTVKSYNQPRRDQRQQVMEAAKELGIMVHPEGGSTFTHNMSMILDGHSGIEHNIPIYPVYEDVTTLWGNSNTGYTPTHVVNYGSIRGENYFYQKTNVWEKERLLNFTPRSIVDPLSRHRMKIPEEEYEQGHILSAEKSKALTDAGVKVNMGAHGQMQGLAAHWEMWIFEQGGMTPLEAIRTSTYNGAHYIGMGEHLGSIEEGKLADLIVIDGNPDQDVRDSEYVSYTMINGRLFDADTMNEIGNHPRERMPFWWEQTERGEQFDWYMHSEGETLPAGEYCICTGQIHSHQ